MHENSVRFENDVIQIVLWSGNFPQAELRHHIPPWGRTTSAREGSVGLCAELSRLGCDRNPVLNIIVLAPKWPAGSRSQRRLSLVGCPQSVLATKASLAEPICWRKFRFT